ncbi:hypothetical protein CUR178_01624 [Leishmania enriettii]|uniref:Uncharacterized protein n=1 Tax=Leishmania enriettii TaxID=5663 RepID=A0A836KK91_LEIEN|nr:hypothetical protein CUR178_01624 [Leishmania enriettii]
MAAPNALSCSSLRDDLDACWPRRTHAVILTLDGAAACLLSAIDDYRRCAVAASDDAETNREPSKEAAALSVMVHMQRLPLVCHAGQTPTTCPTSAAEIMHSCVERWVAWLESLDSQSLTLASKVAVYLSPLQACWRGVGGVAAAASIHTHQIEEAISHFFARAARRCLLEWTTHGIPLRTLLPPLALLTAYARFRWAWSCFAELTPIGDDGRSGVAEARKAVKGPSEAAQRLASKDVDFVGITCEVESCHSNKLVREVLLQEFKVIDWRVGNAVPAVKGVAPLVWCLFLRCRSYALHDQSQKCSSSDFFAYEASARLVAEVLRRTVDGVRLCLEKQSPDMHEARAEQLSTCDIPCLVLLTRLWFSWISLASDAASVLLPPLEFSLRRLVSSAVELRSVVAKKTPLSSRTSNLEEDDDEASRTEQEGRFIEVAWKVTPLTMSEIASASAATPWSSAFARASEVQAVLDKRTVVAPVP